MAKGVPTPAFKVREFRAKFIELGRVSAAARAVGLPITTAWYLAEKAEDDPEFVEARKRIDARALAHVEDLMLEAVDAVQARVLEPDLGPREIAALINEYELRSFNYQNPKPHYLRSIIDAHKSITARSKLDAEKSGEISPAAVTIQLVAVDGDGNAIGDVPADD